MGGTAGSWRVVEKGSIPNGGAGVGPGASLSVRKGCGGERRGGLREQMGN